MSLFSPEKQKIYFPDHKQSLVEYSMDYSNIEEMNLNSKMDNYFPTPMEKEALYLVMQIDVYRSDTVGAPTLFLLLTAKTRKTTILSGLKLYSLFSGSTVRNASLFTLI